VFNTEAHAFPRFELGKNFFTGWKRKQRDAEGRLVEDVENVQKPAAGEKHIVKEEVKEEKLGTEGEVGRMRVVEEVK
jgi:hypothetical protein